MFSSALVGMFVGTSVIMALQVSFYCWLKDLLENDVLSSGWILIGQNYSLVCYGLMVRPFLHISHPQGTLNPDQLVQWGWRVPFLVAGVGASMVGTVHGIRRPVQGLLMKSSSLFHSESPCFSPLDYPPPGCRLLRAFFCA